MDRKINLKLEQLWKRGKDFLGVEVPIMGGAMTWVSESSLVSATSNSGAFGVLASGSMNAEQLKGYIEQTKAKTTKPFGVNIILINPKYQELVDLCIQQNISHIILAGGVPTDTQIAYILKANIKVIAFAPNLSLAKRLVKNGVSALIIEGSEAGGHIGPVSTSVLAQEILPYIKDVPIFVAGGIGSGDIISMYLQMGASGIQIGTLLVCTNECIAHENFKNSFLKANARDAQSTVQIDNNFAVIPVRAIINQGTLNFVDFQKQVIADFNNGLYSTKQEAQLKIEHYWAGALRKAVVDGDVVNGSLMAGQSVGMVNDILPVEQLISRLIKQASDCL
jgi:enoyl-[acyl-carrier protein] reductase II